MIDLAAGVLPLALLRESIDRVREQDNDEQQARLNMAILDSLVERDKDLLQVIKEFPGASKAAKEFFQSDHMKRAAEAEVESYLEVDQPTRDILLGLNRALEDEGRLSSKAQNDTEYWQERLLASSKKLDMVPPEETVAEAIEDRDEIIKSINALEQDIAGLDREIEQVNGHIILAEKKLNQVIRKDLSVQLRKNDTSRIIHFSQKSLDRAQAFEKVLLSRSIHKLESAISDSIHQLFRKENFIKCVKIDVETFNIELITPSGDGIPLTRLSAAERQLLVIAVLWGLAKSSGRPLPLIVDTPLGRLDSQHRINLVERYYSNASHQVMLLSTDTEVNEDMLKGISESTSSQYLLEHDAKSRRTTIKEGYFWSAQ